MSATASARNSSYVAGDKLRFYPRGVNHHYTAVVLKDGSVMAIHNRRIYKNPEVWCKTLPDWNLNQIFVNRYGFNPAASPEPAAAAVPAAPIKKRACTMRYIYPYKTLLRYYPDDSENHSTAIVFSETHVMQIKPEKETFNSVTEWLEFLAEDAYEEDLTVQMPGHAEYPHTKCDIPQRKMEADDVEETLTESFDGMVISITGPSKKAKRSLDAIFQSMKL
jgi:hypothetical protein